MIPEGVEKNIRAFIESIEHWERMRDDPWNGDEEPTAKQCPLCKLYDVDEDFVDGGCMDCPICEFTGFGGCSRTPYDDAFVAFNSRNESTWGSAAQREIDFLRYVLFDYMDKHGVVQWPLSQNSDISPEPGAYSWPWLRVGW